MKRTIKRIALFLAYALVVLSLILSLFRFGLVDPIVVFCSWGVPLARLLWPTFAGIAAFTLLYYGGLFFLTAGLSSMKKAMGFPFITIIIHGIGCVIAYQPARAQESAFGSLSWATLLLSTVFAVSYFWIDWSLARTKRSDSKD